MISLKYIVKRCRVLGLCISRILCNFIIILLFICFNNSLSNENNNSNIHYNFSFHYDEVGCLNCKLIALKNYIKTFSKEFPQSNINIIYGGERKSNYQSLKKQFTDFEVIWDTLDNFSKSNKNILSLALQVSDSENTTLKIFSKIDTNPIDYRLIKELQIKKNLNNAKVLYTINNELLTITNDIEFDKEGHLLTIDMSSNSLKCIDIQNDSLIYEITPINSLDTFFIDTNMIKLYNILTNNTSSVSTLRHFYFNNSDEIFLNYSVISDIKIDSVVKFDGTDSILDISRKIYSRGLLLNNNHGKIIMQAHPDGISLNNIKNIYNNYYTIINYFNNFTYNDIMASDTFNVILQSNDPFFRTYTPLLTYRQLIEEYNLKDFNTRTIGLFHIVDNTNYFYLNPWNNIFFKYENSKFKKINIQGFMTNLFRKDKKKGYRYTINNMLIKDTKAYILLQEFDNRRKCEKIVVQVYDEDNGFEREYIFSKDNETFFAAFLVASANKTYLIYQNKDENWDIIDFFGFIK